MDNLVKTDKNKFKMNVPSPEQLAKIASGFKIIALHMKGKNKQLTI